MANYKHLEKIREGVTSWNVWRTENQGVEPNLLGADLQQLELKSAHLRGADLRAANLNGTYLVEADLAFANLDGAYLHEANLSGANLRGAKLRGVKVSETHFANADLRVSQFHVAENLEGADFESADLRNSELPAARLGAVNLKDARLNGAFMRSANLTEAILRGVDFTGANLHGALLRNADMQRADLSSTYIVQADLSNANLQDASFGETVFGDTNLSGTTGLESCKHSSPSFVDVNTCMLSGSLPLLFLRGCGLPDVLIDYLPSLVNQPVQFYSCFISHTNKDKEFAHRLYTDLQGSGVRCWYAPKDLKIGDRFQQVIETSIRVHDKLLIVLSENALESPWVGREVQAAREREDRDKKLVLFPVRLDDAIMDASESWAADLRRTRHIGDFSRWKDHDFYRASFEQLLHDLTTLAGVRPAPRERKEDEDLFRPDYSHAIRIFPMDS
jgi:uncharacterized protein YjbI with pentapeptide repeats